MCGVGFDENGNAIVLWLGLTGWLVYKLHFGFNPQCVQYYGRRPVSVYGSWPSELSPYMRVASKQSAYTDMQGHTVIHCSRLLTTEGECEVPIRAL